MDGLLAALRYACRVIVKNPAFSAVAIAALALGIGANAAIFSVVNGVLLQPLPYSEPERLMRLCRKYPNGEGCAVSLPKFMTWRRAQAFDAMTAYDFAGPGVNLSGGDRPEQVRGIHVSADYFRVFGTIPAIGRTFTAEEDRPGGAYVAVLAHSLWTTRFGSDPSIVGKTIVLNSEPYTVIGILPDRFRPDPKADVFIPLQADPNSANQGHFLSGAAKRDRDPRRHRRQPRRHRPSGAGRKRPAVVDRRGRRSRAWRVGRACARRAQSRRSAARRGPRGRVAPRLDPRLAAAWIHGRRRRPDRNPVRSRAGAASRACESRSRAEGRRRSRIDRCPRRTDTWRTCRRRDVAGGRPARRRAAADPHVRGPSSRRSWIQSQECPDGRDVARRREVRDVAASRIADATGNRADQRAARRAGVGAHAEPAGVPELRPAVPHRRTAARR